ncbi:MAG: OmpA family protein [Bacteroidia bacterium]|nr:OmpA family protein [Bacteroidia bacterium]MDW8058388.1 OmpA family protein [Bacteroidia bacterium]
MWHIWGLGLCISLLVWAQPRLRVLTGTYLRPIEGEVVTPPPVEFPNLFSEKKAERSRKFLKALAEAESEEDIPRIDSLLRSYVTKFSVHDFRDTTSLQFLWRWAQVREFLKDTLTSSYLYGLCLRNMRNAPSEIRVAYRRLQERWRSEWVPLEYYRKIARLRQKIDTLAPPKGVLLSLGPHINSPHPDYAPYMHPSGQVLIFTSRRDQVLTAADPDQLRNEDLYFSQRDIVRGGFRPAEKFRDIINSPYNEGSACLNSDGTLLIFARCDSPDGYGSCDLYESRYEEGRWQTPRNLGPTINSSAWDSHPFLVGDSLLFFASNRPGGFGQSDIYMSRLQPNGKWSPPQNLGPLINTNGDEVTPYYYEPYQTLYFSSTGQPVSYGGYDIYKSRWNGSFWEEPRNLGPLVNTDGDEYYFTIDGRGNKIYYARATKKDRRNFDLYSFELPMEARPDAITKLSGYLIDSLSGQPLVGVVIAIDLTEGTEITPVFANKYGYFEFRLVQNRQYQLMVLDTHLIRIPDTLTLIDDKNFSIFLTTAELQRPYILENLEFPTNSAEIPPESYGRLDYIANFLLKYPFVTLRVEGHTDAIGDPAYNRKLSQQRAENIRKYLLEVTGLPPDQIIAKGYGPDRPLLPNTTEENRARNRRVEFILEVPPEKLTLMRLDFAFGDEWDLLSPEAPPEESEEYMTDPEFIFPEIELPDLANEFEEVVSRDFDPPMLPEEEDENEEEP